MNKTVKGALAASTAAVLLLGGAGSLAYWNDSDTVDGATFTAGDLQIDAADCDTASWEITHGAGAAADFDPATGRIVPGDVITKTCTVDIIAIGENLEADLDVTGGARTGTMASGAYTVDGDFELGGAALDTLTADNDGDSIDAVITVTFTKGSTVDNASKLKTINLADYTVSAVQS